MKTRLVWKDDVCPICGRKESVHTFKDQCLQVGMLKAKADLLATPEGRNQWYRIEVEEVMPRLAAYWEESGSKVKNKFVKEFTPSVLEFYQEKGYVSKKQLDAALSVLERSCGLYAHEARVMTDNKRGDMLAEYAQEHYQYDELEWKDLRKKVRYYYKQGWLL